MISSDPFPEDDVIMMMMMWVKVIIMLYDSEIDDLDQDTL